MYQIQNAKDELLREAQKSGNQICKLQDGSGFFVKARRGYSYPREERMLYLQAFGALEREGKFKLVLRNRDLELYEVDQLDGYVSSKADAKEVLLTQLRSALRVYKIHSPSGEFVQVHDKAYNDIDEERILFLKALSELVRHGQIQLVSDSQELARFELARPRIRVMQNRRSDLDEAGLEGPSAHAA